MFHISLMLIAKALALCPAIQKQLLNKLQNWTFTDTKLAWLELAIYVAYITEYR